MTKNKKSKHHAEKAGEHKHAHHKKHADNSSAIKKAAEKQKANDSKLMMSWVFSAIVITGLLLWIVFMGNTTECPAVTTGNAVVQDEFIFLKSDACTDACDEMEPVIKEYAQKAGLEFRKVRYPQEVPIPGYFVLSQDETSVPTGIQDEGTLIQDLCSITENEEICAESEEASKVAAQKAMEEQQKKLEGMPKLDKPVIDAFVMSHCPYGTQIEKGLLPVVELLGNKVEFNIRYVDYAMHGETEVYEQLNQYCIQKEQPDKFVDYLKCFLKAGNGEECIASIGIDTQMLESCTTKTDAKYDVTTLLEDQSTWANGRFPQFNIDKELNEKYDVRGSPHLVINGQTASANRDSASLLAAVCASFTTAPEECQQTLSSASPSPGFGYEESGSASSATCG